MLPAIVAVVVLVVGQLVAFAHEAAERHVTCAEHGEQLETVDVAQARHECSDDHLDPFEDDGDGDHEDCAIARALRQASNASSLWTLPRIAVVETLSVRASWVTLRISAASLYLIAPKTSPPA